VVLLIALMIAAPGCLVGGRSDVRREGTFVAASTLDQIEPGKTSKSWVKAVVGEPTHRVKIGPNHEVWKYAYTETKNSSGYVFLVFGTSNKKVTDSNVFVEFEGDVVSKTWRG
jgi:outer membrane protein assembly factor BamE (lipoprotein component of BamABCDE complex)